MTFADFLTIFVRGPIVSRPLAPVGGRALVACLLPLGVCSLLLAGYHPARGETVSESEPKKHVIGATATISEASSGVPFAARIDTGAQSCSIHVEKFEIEDESPRPLRNIGKTIRFEVKNEKGESGWVESKITGRVRVKSSVQKDGDYHGRYKVRLTLVWQGVSKEVSVSLNDRTDMAYPLLIGRNYLRGDFLVDVAKAGDD